MLACASVGLTFAVVGYILIFGSVFLVKKVFNQQKEKEQK
jgi:hypothetical protein